MFELIYVSDCLMFTHPCTRVCTCTHTYTPQTLTLLIWTKSHSSCIIPRYIKIYILLVVVGQNVQAEICFKTTVNVKESSVLNTIHYLNMLILTGFRVNFKVVTVSTNYDENTFIGQCVLEYLFQALNVRMFVSTIKFSKFPRGMPPDP